MKIAIGSDKSGFILKEAIKKLLTELEIEFDDLGTQNMDTGVPYFKVASTIAPLVVNKTYDKAILICGTGAGMSVVANKYKGITAVACESVYAAKMCRSINNANILCMGGWIVAEMMAIQMVKAFLSTDFLQDLEEWRKTFLTNTQKEVGLLEDSIYTKNN